jgi:hypothetical protein
LVPSGSPSSDPSSELSSSASGMPSFVPSSSPSEGLSISPYAVPTVAHRHLKALVISASESPSSVLSGTPSSQPSLSPSDTPRDFSLGSAKDTFKLDWIVAATTCSQLGSEFLAFYWYLSCSKSILRMFVPLLEYLLPCVSQRCSLYCSKWCPICFAELCA